MSDIVARLRNGSERFLAWAHKKQYSGPPVISIPVHEDNIDRLLEEAAQALTTARDDALEEAAVEIDCACEGECLAPHNCPREYARTIRALKGSKP